MHRTSADRRKVSTALSSRVLRMFCRCIPDEQGLPSTVKPAPSSRQACYGTNDMVREVVPSHGIRVAERQLRREFLAKARVKVEKSSSRVEETRVFDKPAERRALSRHWFKVRDGLSSSMLKSPSAPSSARSSLASPRSSPLPAKSGYLSEIGACGSKTNWPKIAGCSECLCR